MADASMKGTAQYRLLCTVPGCNKSRQISSFDALDRAVRMCEMHRQRVRRNGSPHVVNRITVFDLRRYEKRIRELLALVNFDKVEAGLTQQHFHALEQAQAFLAEGRDKERRLSAAERWPRQAGEIMARVLEAVSPVDLAVRIAAVWLIQAREPHRFPDDVSFDWALARAFRGASMEERGSFYNEKIGRAHKVFREVPPRVNKQLAEAIKMLWARFGSLIVNTDRKELSRHVAVKVDLSEGFAERPQPAPSRAIALKQGRRYYLSPDPCRRGHFAPRRTRDGGCMKCRSLYESIRKKKRKQQFATSESLATPTTTPQELSR